MTDFIESTLAVSPWSSGGLVDSLSHQDTTLVIHRRSSFQFLPPVQASSEPSPSCHRPARSSPPRTPEWPLRCVPRTSDLGQQIISCCPLTANLRQKRGYSLVVPCPANDVFHPTAIPINLLHASTRISWRAPQRVGKSHQPVQRAASTTTHLPAACTSNSSLED